MTPSSSPGSASRLRRPLLLAMLLVAAFGLVLLVRLGSDRDGLAGPGDLSAPAAGDGPSTLDTPEASGPSSARSTVPVIGNSGEETPREDARSVLCLSSVDRAPLAGVRLYAGPRAVAGPSDEGGLLAFGDPTQVRESLVLWRDGFAPIVRRPAEPWPKELLFDPADGELEVRLEGVDDRWRVLRSHLEPRSRVSTGTAAWDPHLREISPDLLLARGIPRGSYDVYVWLRSPVGAPVPLSQAEVDVTAGARARVVLDARHPVPEDDD